MIKKKAEKSGKSDNPVNKGSDNGLQYPDITRRIIGYAVKVQSKVNPLGWHHHVSAAVLCGVVVSFDSRESSCNCRSLINETIAVYSLCR